VVQDLPPVMPDTLSETPEVALLGHEPSPPKTPGERVRIAFVIDAIDDWEAGTEQHLRKLLAALDPSSFAPELYFLRPSLSLAPADFPCPVHVAGNWPHVKWYRPQVLWRLVKFLRARRPHIVQTFFRDGTYYGTLAARVARVPAIVISVRNAGYWRRGIDQLPLKVAYRLAGYWQCNSRWVAKPLENQFGFDHNRVEVLPNAIDLTKFRPPTPVERLAARRDLCLLPGAAVFVSVANLRPVKDLSTLLVAASLVRRELLAAQFLLVGEGPLRETLESQAALLNLNPAVRFLGAHADVRPYLAAADVGLLTSRSEASSNAILEYMATGLPVLASGIPANRELLGEGFFEPGNASELAAKVVALWRDPNARLRMSRENLRRVAPYGLEPFAERARNYYWKLAARTEPLR